MSQITVENIKRSTETASRSTRGVAAAWVNFNGTGTVAVRDSENVASLTDQGTGEYTINLSNSFGAADYHISTDATWNAGVSASTNTSIQGDAGTKPIVSAFGFVVYRTPDDVRYDPEFAFGSTHGDLA